MKGHLVVRLTLVVLALVGLMWLIGLPGLPDRDRALAGHQRRAAAAVPARVDVAWSAPGVPVPRSYLGISSEYWTLPLYRGHLDQFERVLALLHVPGDGPLILRVGGDSADLSFWQRDPGHLPSWAYGLNPRWLGLARQIVEATGVRLILDLNLVTNTPARATSWAAAAEQLLPRGSIAAFEIGNEPDIYSRRDWMATLMRSPLASAPVPRALKVRQYIRAFRAYDARLDAVAPGVPLAGPAIANPSSHAGWVARLISAVAGHIGLVTAHRYPFSACSRRAWATYPTIGRLLSQRASAGTAHAVVHAVSLAHRSGLPLRLTELNSVACGGMNGLSNSFATALWSADTLFELMAAHVDGVNIHVRAYPVNAAFAFGRRGLNARPLLYGMLLFTRTLGAGGRLVPAVVHSRPGLNLKAWAVRLPGGRLHLLLLDKGNRAVRVRLGLPAGAAGTVQRLLAPSIRSSSGVTLAGQHLTRAVTWSGTLANSSLSRGPRGYVVTVPRDSAALVLISRSSSASSPALPTVRVSRGRPIRWAARCAAAHVAGVGRCASHRTRV
jgi:hypothetical protein